MPAYHYYFSGIHSDRDLHRTPRARACYALWGMAIPDAPGQGPASGSGHPGGPQRLDPGARRDDVATLLPGTPRSVQHASHALELRCH
jgi:hypothetical protein